MTVSWRAMSFILINDIVRHDTTMLFIIRQRCLPRQSDTMSK